jgi:hypothetical protein
LLEQTNMATSQEDILKDLATLIKEEFSAPPKEYSEEELAVKQTIQMLVTVLSQPSKQHSVVPTVSIDSIINMTKLGQLTLVAQKLEDNFLESIKQIVSKSTVTFNYGDNGISLINLYEFCHGRLWQSQSKEPRFSDVLLKMYTVNSPFYKKMNAILGSYNQSDDTSKEEYLLSFLLNIAIHKAGLEKRKLEVQKPPDELYRGQSFGLDGIKEKFARVKEFHTQGKLTKLTPTELSEVNIVDIAAKKTLSTTDQVFVTTQFTGESNGIVLHVKNPKDIADYYNVANISEHPTESEFMSRIPDDIAMIPINMEKDRRGTYHVHVVCIRSASVLLQKSTRLNTLNDDLTRYIENTIKEYKDNKFNPVKRTMSKVQISIFKDMLYHLKNLVAEDSGDALESRTYLLRTAYTSSLNSLYSNKHLTKEQKKVIDTLKTKLDTYYAVLNQMSVVHSEHDPAKETRQALNNIEENISGKKIWLETISDTEIDPIKANIDVIMDQKTTHTQLKQAAIQIINTLKKDTSLAKKFTTLEASMTDLINNVDTIANNLEHMIEATKTWLKTLSGTDIDPIKANIDTIIDQKATHTQLKQAATQIINTLKTDTNLANKFPTLEVSMEGLIKNVDTRANNLKHMPNKQKSGTEAIINKPVFPIEKFSTAPKSEFAQFKGTQQVEDKPTFTNSRGKAQVTKPEKNSSNSDNSSNQSSQQVEEIITYRSPSRSTAQFKDRQGEIKAVSDIDNDYSTKQNPQQSKERPSPLSSSVEPDKLSESTKTTAKYREKIETIQKNSIDNDYSSNQSNQQVEKNPIFLARSRDTTQFKNTPEKITNSTGDSDNSGNQSNQQVEKKPAFLALSRGTTLKDRPEKITNSNSDSDNSNNQSNQQVEEKSTITRSRPKLMNKLGMASDINSDKSTKQVNTFLARSRGPAQVKDEPEKITNVNSDGDNSSNQNNQRIEAKHIATLSSESTVQFKKKLREIKDVNNINNDNDDSTKPGNT